MAQIRVGNLIVDLVQRQITREGAPIRTSWRAFELFRLLLEAGGRPVEKEELLRKVWAGEFVAESNLTQAVAQLRKALDPPPDGDSYVATVPRIGYRIAIKVEQLPADAAQPVDAPPSWRRRLLWLTVATICSCFVFLVVIQPFTQENQAERLARTALTLGRTGAEPNLKKAEALLAEALQADPESALAMAAKADLIARTGILPGTSVINLAKQAVDRDPQCAECRAILGYILLSKEWDWTQSRRYLEPTGSVAPVAETYFGWAHWLAATGRISEAIVALDKAAASNPTDFRHTMVRSSLLFFQERHQDAMVEAYRSLALDQQSPAAHVWLTWISLTLDRPGEAVHHHIMTLGKREGWSADLLRMRLDESAARIRNGGGQQELARWLADCGYPGCSFKRSTYHVYLGHEEEALVALKDSIKYKNFHTIFAAVNPLFQPLYGDPRFVEILKQVGTYGLLPVKLRRRIDPQG